MKSHSSHSCAIIVKGFSLVEILVVLGLFSSIGTLVLGSLFNAQAINGRLQETQAILDNVNLSIQTVTRDMRFGTDFYCATSVPYPQYPPTNRKSCAYGSTSGGTVVVFKQSEANNSLDRVGYYIQNGVLYKTVYPSTGTSTTYQMTANDVVIQHFKIYIDGAQTSDGSNDFGGATDQKQPLITLFISGYARSTHSTRPPVSFSIQTVVSARELDNR